MKNLWGERAIRVDLEGEKDRKTEAELDGQCECGLERKKGLSGRRRKTGLYGGNLSNINIYSICGGKNKK